MEILKAVSWVSRKAGLKAGWMANEWVETKVALKVEKLV